jgi:predicted RNase H-like nuclease (RuvC/YqgF family)
VEIEELFNYRLLQSIMFNPKERLEQIRRNKTNKEEVSNYIAETPAPPLFHPAPPETPDLSSRISRLENAIQELTSELSSSKQLITSLKHENSELETKVLKL